MLAISPTPALLLEQYWILRNTFCLGTDNEVSVGALNHVERNSPMASSVTV